MTSRSCCNVHARFQNERPAGLDPLLDWGSWDPSMEWSLHYFQVPTSVRDFYEEGVN